MEHPWAMLSLDGHKDDPWLPQTPSTTAQPIKALANVHQGLVNTAIFVERQKGRRTVCEERRSASLQVTRFYFCFCSALFLMPECPTAKAKCQTSSTKYCGGVLLQSAQPDGEGCRSTLSSVLSNRQNRPDCFGKYKSNSEVLPKQPLRG